MRVITFSRNFPKKHPKEGQPTNFVEKIWSCFGLDSRYIGLLPVEQESFVSGDFDHWEKFHTIRVGNRWRVGDYFSPRVWSGKPYASKQIEFSPPIEIKKIWSVDINFHQSSSVMIVNKSRFTFEQAIKIARNDGLDMTDFVSWFNIHPKAKDGFEGQILCWSKSTIY